MRKLRVPARDLLFALRNRVPGTVHFLDTETGEVIPVFGFNRDKVMEQVHAHRERYLRLAPETSRQGYEIVKRFINLVGRAEVRHELEQTIQGEHAFRKFRERLEQWPDEKLRWQKYRAEMTADSVRRRLAESGITLVLDFGPGHDPQPD